MDEWAGGGARGLAADCVGGRLRGWLAGCLAG